MVIELHSPFKSEVLLIIYNTTTETNQVGSSRTVKGLEACSGRRENINVVKESLRYENSNRGMWGTDKTSRENAILICSCGDRDES